MMRRLLLLAGVAIATSPLFSAPAQAAYGRQYYGSWGYYPSRSYYYQSYYYKPYPTYSSYYYHYCIYYPKYPRYVYYYNPYKRVYWGRYDCEAKGYSLLAEKDRKGDLSAIPESAFPKPGKMPPIPESTDGVAIEPTAPPTPEKSKDGPPKEEGPPKEPPAKG
jgi:hypothetical protein